MRNSWVMDHPITQARAGKRRAVAAGAAGISLSRTRHRARIAQRDQNHSPGAENFVDPSRLTVILEEADPEFDDPVAIGGISGQGAPRTRSKPHMGNGSSGE
jgi:hypothetical protein